jgi:PBP1b-binding outer membrane lipoprotein LpoB
MKTKHNNFIGKRISLLISLMLIVGCGTRYSHKTIVSKLQERLFEEKTETSLVLFIAESMCSECINVEFQNIKKNKDVIKSLTIIGVFGHKRHFDACIASLTNSHIALKKIYINLSSG